MKRNEDDIEADRSQQPMCWYVPLRGGGGGCSAMLLILTDPVTALRQKLCLSFPAIKVTVSALPLVVHNTWPPVIAGCWLSSNWGLTSIGCRPSWYQSWRPTWCQAGTKFSGKLQLRPRTNWGTSSRQSVQRHQEVPVAIFEEIRKYKTELNKQLFARESLFQRYRGGKYCQLYACETVGNMRVSKRHVILFSNFVDTVKQK